MTDHDAKVATNKYRGEAATYRTENSRTPTEEWIGTLGTTFIEVSFYVKGAFVREQHVDDPETLEETIRMAIGRIGGRCALYDAGGEKGWCLLSHDRVRHYDTKEAAEMVMIHRG